MTRSLDEFVAVIRQQWNLGQSSACGFSRDERVDAVVRCMSDLNDQWRHVFSQAIRDRRFNAN